MIGSPLLGVNPSVSIVRMIMIGYFCNCLNGQHNYQASAHWLTRELPSWVKGLSYVEVLLGGQSSSYVQTTLLVFLCCEATGG